MTTVKQIPISLSLWEEITELKGNEQSFDDLLSHMVDLEKKNRLMEDMKSREEEGEFVEMIFES
jgi:predicted CopG family antitoxin